MKRLGTLVAVSVLVAGASTAWANNINGTIKSIDAKNHELTLDDGKTYEVASNVTLEGLKPGDKVKINAEMKNGKNFVDKVEQTSSAAMNGSASTSASGGSSSTNKVMPLDKTPEKSAAPSATAPSPLPDSAIDPK